MKNKLVEGGIIIGEILFGNLLENLVEELIVVLPIYFIQFEHIIPNSLLDFFRNIAFIR